MSLRSQPLHHAHDAGRHLRRRRETGRPHAHSAPDMIRDPSRSTVRTTDADTLAGNAGAAARTLTRERT